MADNRRDAKGSNLSRKQRRLEGKQIFQNTVVKGKIVGTGTTAGCKQRD